MYIQIGIYSAKSNYDMNNYEMKICMWLSCVPISTAQRSRRWESIRLYSYLREVGRALSACPPSLYSTPSAANDSADSGHDENY